MDKEQFKSILIKAKHVILETEANKNLELLEAFCDHYDDLAPMVFAGFSENRIYSPGFKLYVQQVLDMVYELDVTTDMRKQREVIVFSGHKQVIGNILNFNDFRNRKNGNSANSVRSIRTS